MQQPRAHRAAEGVLSIGEKHERECGRQRKAAPRRKTAKIAGPHEADGKSDLAARGARQELAEADEIGIGVFVQPAAAHDEFVAKIADVSDRPAEAGDAELEEGKQNFERRTGPAVSLGGARGDGHYGPSCVLQECHEPEIHVQLLVAVKECQSRIVGDEVEFEFLKSAQHDHVLDHASGRFACDARQFETVPMQMQRVNVVTGVADFDR